MTNTVLPRKLIDDVIDLMNCPVEIYEGYSGRGMYGAECFGLTFETSSDAHYFFTAIGIILGQAEERDEEIAGYGSYPTELAYDLTRASRTDSLGYGTIVYFPGFEID